METFGAYLKRERELRGISLREVAQTTKISLHTLELLEAERFDEIGGEIFVRGFLRNSARYLGLNPEDVVLRYDEFRQQSRPAQESSPGIDLPALADRKLVMVAGGFLVFVAAIVLLTWAFSGSQPSSEGQENTGLTALPVPEIAAAPVLVTAPAAAAVTAAAVAASAPVVLVIHATDTTYVKLWIDGALPIEREMQPGATERFAADQKIEILAGNAGGISLTLNGAPLPSLGPLGRVRRRVITTQGISTP